MANPNLKRFERALRTVNARHRGRTEAADEQRAAVIRAAYEAGMTQREIARHTGLSFQRIHQIIHGTR
jgi:hypothetical protein